MHTPRYQQPRNTYLRAAGIRHSLSRSLLPPLASASRSFVPFPSRCFLSLALPAAGTGRLRTQRDDADTRSRHLEIRFADARELFARPRFFPASRRKLLPLLPRLLLAASATFARDVNHPTASMLYRPRNKDRNEHRRPGVPSSYVAPRWLLLSRLHSSDGAKPRGITMFMFMDFGNEERNEELTSMSPYICDI